MVVQYAFSFCIKYVPMLYLLDVLYKKKNSYIHNNTIMYKNLLVMLENGEYKNLLIWCYLSDYPFFSKEKKKKRNQSNITKHGNFIVTNIICCDNINYNFP